MSIFQHKSIEIAEPYRLLISPSLLSKFYTNPSEWFANTVIGETTFKGNTSTVLGTICHYIYNCVCNKKEVTREFINAELDKFIEMNPSEEIDYDIIKKEYPEVSKEVVNSYLYKWNFYKSNLIMLSEYTMYTRLTKDIVLGGTCDLIENLDNEYTIVDFKTVSKKPSKVIPLAYKLQLMAYAYLVKKTFNVEPKYIRIVYGVRPLKSIGARCEVVTEEITSDLWRVINNTLELVIDTMELYWEHPQWSYILFKNYDLKGFIQ